MKKIALICITFTLLFGNEEEAKKLLDVANQELKSNRIDEGLTLIAQAYEADNEVVLNSKASKLLNIATALSYLKSYARAHDDPNSYRAIGDIYFDLGLFDLAHDFYAQSVMHDELSTHARVHEALCSMAMGERYQAVLELQHVLKYDPENFHANYYLGKFLKYYMQDTKNAKPYYEKAKKHIPNDSKSTQLAQEIEQELAR